MRMVRLVSVIEFLGPPTTSCSSGSAIHPRARTSRSADRPSAGALGLSQRALGHVRPRWTSWMATRTTSGARQRRTGPAPRRGRHGARAQMPAPARQGVVVVGARATAADAAVRCSSRWASPTTMPARRSRRRGDVAALRGRRRARTQTPAGGARGGGHGAPRDAQPPHADARLAPPPPPAARARSRPAPAPAPGAGDEDEAARRVCDRADRRPERSTARRCTSSVEGLQRRDVGDRRTSRTRRRGWLRRRPSRASRRAPRPCRAAAASAEIGGSGRGRAAGRPSVAGHAEQCRARALGRSTFGPGTCPAVGAARAAVPGCRGIADDGEAWRLGR